MVQIVDVGKNKYEVIRALSLIDNKRVVKMRSNYEKIFGPLVSLRSRIDKDEVLICRIIDDVEIIQDFRFMKRNPFTNSYIYC